MRRDLLRMSVDAFVEFCRCIRDPEKKKGSAVPAIIIRDAVNIISASYTHNLIVPALVDWGRCFNVRIGQHLFGHDLAADDDLLSQLNFECVPAAVLMHRSDVL